MNKKILVAFIICLGISGLKTANGENMSDNPFGVLEFLHWNHPWNNYKYATHDELEKAVQLMRKAGVGFVRMDFLWQDIEPQRGSFNFSKYDFIVDLLHENDIGILGILDYTADWASPRGRWNYPPKDNQRFVAYCRRVAERYREKIRYWEVWNEPDSHTYWEPQDGLASYCVLLKDVYTALKEVDFGFKVLNGGLAGGLSSVNNLYDHGGKGYFDILNLHIFESPLHEGAIGRVLAYPRLARKVMARNGDQDKPIWITETGCPGVPQGVETNNWWMGSNPDEEEQAAWLEQVLSGLLKVDGVQKIFWAFFRDTNKHWKDGTDYFGMVRWDFSEKPSYSAFRKCFESWKRGQGL